MSYYLNPSNILSDPSISDIAKAALRRTMKQTVLLPGHWLRDLPTADVEQLVAMLEQSAEEDRLDRPGPAGEELILLTLILSTGEGCAPQNDDEVVSYSGRLVAMIICESLARKGLARVFHDKMSFVELDTVVVQRL